MGMFLIGVVLVLVVIWVAAIIHDEKLDQERFEIIENRLKTLEKWVSSGGKFSSINEAIELTKNSSIGNSYVIKVEPGTYHEDPISLKSVEEK